MEAKARTRKKRTVFVSLAVLAMGVPPLVNSLGNPRLAGLHGPDVLQLTAIGFCVGLALGLFLGLFFGGRESS
jgi:hypothetical protein